VSILGFVDVRLLGVVNIGNNGDIVDTGLEAIISVKLSFGNVVESKGRLERLVLLLILEVWLIVIPTVEILCEFNLDRETLLSELEFAKLGIPVLMSQIGISGHFTSYCELLALVILLGLVLLT
jgi:hypothetical protein